MMIVPPSLLQLAAVIPLTTRVDVLVKWETTVCWNCGVSLSILDLHVPSLQPRIHNQLCGASTMSPAKDPMLAVQWRWGCITSSVKHIFVDGLLVKVTSTCLIQELMNHLEWFAMIVLCDAIPGRTDLRHLRIQQRSEIRSRSFC